MNARRFLMLMCEIIITNYYDSDLEKCYRVADVVATSSTLC